MKREVGDEVMIKSLDWYKKHADHEGDVYAGSEYFVSEMSEYCGKLAKITNVDDNDYYNIDIDAYQYRWTDEMFEDKNPSDIFDDIWTFGELFVVVNKKTKRVFPEFFTKRKEAEEKLWKIINTK